MSLPRVFISHSSSDKDFAVRLALDLKARGIDVWIDVWELKVGDSLTEKIQQGIKSSSYLIAILSPESVASPWVRVELQAALRHEIESRRVYVLPVLLRDCEMPLFLQDKLYADFRHGQEDGMRSLLFALGSSATEFKGGHELRELVTHAVIVDKLDEMSVEDLNQLVRAIELRFLDGRSTAEDTGTSRRRRRKKRRDQGAGGASPATEQDALDAQLIDRLEDLHGPL